MRFARTPSVPGIERTAERPTATSRRRCGAIVSADLSPGSVSADVAPVLGLSSDLVRRAKYSPAFPATCRPDTPSGQSASRKTRSQTPRCPCACPPPDLSPARAPCTPPCRQSSPLRCGAWLLLASSRDPVLPLPPLVPFQPPRSSPGQNQAPSRPHQA